MSDPNACPRCGYFTIQAHSAEMCCELLRKEVAARDTEVAELRAEMDSYKDELAAIRAIAKPHSPAALREFLASLQRIRHPKGGDMAEWPEDLRVRELPGGAK